MFKAKRIDTGEIQTILSVYFDETLHQTYFLIWDNGWKWRPSHRYIPPNMELEELKGDKK